MPKNKKETTPMTRIEMEAAEAQIRTAKTLDKILGVLTVITTQLEKQNATLEKLVNKKAEPVPSGMWYYKKEVPSEEEK